MTRVQHISLPTLIALYALCWPAPARGDMRSCWYPTHKTALCKLRAAERLLATAMPGPPTGPTEEPGVSYQLKDARDALMQSEACQPSGRAEELLGWLAELSERWDVAVTHYRRAEFVFLGGARVQAAHCRASRTLWSYQHAQAGTAAQKRKLVEFIRYPLPGRELYAALSFRLFSDGDDTGYDDARITVYERRGKHLLTSWQSATVSSIDQRRFAWFGGKLLYAVRITGSPAPELAFFGVCMGGSANPTVMTVYRRTGSTFRLALTVYSGEECTWLSRLGRDGRLQVRAAKLVGDQLCHAEMIRWPAAYAWNGREFVRADEQYGKAFEDEIDDLRGKLHSHPDDFSLQRCMDWAKYVHGRRPGKSDVKEPTRLARMPSPIREGDFDLWFVLGEAAQTEGNRSRARCCYLRAERAAKRKLHSIAPDSDERYFPQECLNEARLRVAGLRKRAPDATWRARSRANTVRRSLIRSAPGTMAAPTD